jgi:site-specific DNA-methyltransferase (adenine-specific)
MRNVGFSQSLGNKPDKEMLNEILRVSKNTIIWGANNFDYPFKGFIAWDKQVRGADRYSQVEIASLSEGLSTVSKYVAISCLDKNGKIHPTQKPIALYSWILDNYAKEGYKIFDPFIGSGSSRIAAYKKGFDFYACELDKEYYEAQEERFRKECLGEIKLTNGKVAVQQTLF